LTLTCLTDTLWASGYELYDRLTPTYRKFLEGLTAEHRGDFFVAAAKAKGEPLRGHRGSPLNDNQDLKASHPVIRVNPVTGWKSLFVNGVFTKKINELNDEESENLLKFLSEHVHAVSPSYYPLGR
jgi:alpha-ketoglutarate-dependent taurine dioxygenase